MAEKVLTTMMCEPQPPSRKNNVESTDQPPPYEDVTDLEKSGRSFHGYTNRIENPRDVSYQNYAQPSNSHMTGNDLEMVFREGPADHSDLADDQQVWSVQSTPPVARHDVVQNQQPMVHPQDVVVHQPTPSETFLRDWRGGLFNCTEDCGICCCGTFCTMCLLFNTSKRLGESAYMPCLVPLSLMPLRTKWRTQQNIHGSIMEDCLLSACCGPCAICQLARDIKYSKN